MMQTIRPVYTTPEDLAKGIEPTFASEVGTILEVYIMRGPLESQLLMPMAASSPGGPSYRTSQWYFWTVTGRQMDGDHLQQQVSPCRQPAVHHSLQK